MAKRKATEMEEPTNQRSDIAVNAAGYCLVHDWPGRNINQVITAAGSEVERKTHASLLSEYRDPKTGNEHVVFRDDYRVLGQAELVAPEGGEASEWMVVGLALTPHTLKQAGGREHLRQAREGRKFSAVGMDEPQDVDKVVLGKDQRAMLVVMSFAADKTRNKILGCLLYEMDGLRSAYKVSQEDVFFFHEFRDCTKDREKRAGNWWLNAHAAIQRIKEQRDPGGQKRQEMAKEEAAAAAAAMEDGEEPEIPIKEEVARLKHQAPGRPAALEEDAVITATMARFILHDEVFEMKEAEQLYQELRELWPDTRISCARDLRDVHDGMKERRYNVDHRIVYNFLVASTQVLAEHNFRISPGELAERSLQRATQFFYPGKVRMLQRGF